MRVKDLLAALRELPADLEVVIDDPEGELRQIEGAVTDHAYLGTGVVWLGSRPLDPALLEPPRPRVILATEVAGYAGDCPRCGALWLFVDGYHRSICPHLDHFDTVAGGWVLAE